MWDYKNLHINHIIIKTVGNAHNVAMWLSVSRCKLFQSNVKLQSTCHHQQPTSSFFTGGMKSRVYLTALSSRECKCVTCAGNKSSVTSASNVNTHSTPPVDCQSTGVLAGAGVYDGGVELLHVDWVQELPEDLDVCIAQRDFEAAVDLVQKSNFIICHSACVCVCVHGTGPVRVPGL